MQTNTKEESTPPEDAASSLAKPTPCKSSKENTPKSSPTTKKNIQRRDVTHLRKGQALIITGVGRR